MRGFSQFSLPITLVASSALALVLLPVLEPKAPLAFVTPECMALMQQMRSLGPDSNGFEALGEQMKQVCMPSMTTPSSSAPQPAPQTAPPPIDDTPPAKREPKQEKESVNPAPLLGCTKIVKDGCTYLRCNDGTSLNSCMCAKKPVKTTKAKKLPAFTSRKDAPTTPSAPEPPPSSATMEPVQCDTDEQIALQVEECKAKGGVHAKTVDADSCPAVACAVPDPSDKSLCKGVGYNTDQWYIDGRAQTCASWGGTFIFEPKGVKFTFEPKEDGKCVGWACVLKGAYGIPHCTLKHTSKFPAKDDMTICTALSCAGGPKGKENGFAWKACKIDYPQCIELDGTNVCSSHLDIGLFDIPWTSQPTTSFTPCITYWESGCEYTECVENGTITKAKKWETCG